MTAVLVVAFACAAPKTVATIQSPIPSPSPTPTAPLQATGPGFHVGEVGVSYAPVALSAAGGVQPYHWTVSAGALPPGLTVGADGSISGNPTGAGDYTFTIQAADSGDATATVPGHISVASHLALSFIQGCETSCNVELGCVTACGTFGQLSGGVEPFHTTLIDGTLPSGTSLNGLELTGTFAGGSGWLQFTVQVGDSLGAMATLAPKFWMYPHISLGSGSCLGNFNTGCQTQLPFSGGTPGDTASVAISAIGPYCNANGCFPASPSLPPGYVLDLSGGAVAVSIPKGIMAGYHGTWTLVVTDQNPCSSSAHCQTQATVAIAVAGG